MAGTDATIVVPVRVPEEYSKEVEDDLASSSDAYAARNLHSSEESKLRAAYASDDSERSQNDEVAIAVTDTPDESREEWEVEDENEYREAVRQKHIDVCFC